MERTFLTRPNKHKSSFETKYIERFGSIGEKQASTTNISPQLAEKKMEMEKTNEALEDARLKFETWKANFQRKRKELEEKQAILAEQKKSLDQFSIHHNMELEKAKKREDEELKNAKLIEKELESLHKEEEELKQKNNALKAELAALQPCADYLQNVVDTYHNYETVESILNRYQSLAQTRLEYLNKYQDLMSRYGTHETQLDSELESRKAYLIDCTMKFNQGMQRVEQAKQRAEYRRTALVKDVQRIEDKNVELAAIKSAIKNIYSRAVQQSGEKNRKSPDECTPQEMLRFIEDRFLDLKDIITDEHAVKAVRLTSVPNSQIQSSTLNPNISKAKPKIPK